MKCVLMIALAGLIGLPTFASGEELSKSDQLRIAVQEICPVSGGKLGAMGPPVKVKVGEEVVFFCCRGCLKGKIKPENWATIHKNFAKAQGICPVMKKALPSNPKFTIVNGRIVYTCCPSCANKIAADPQTYLAVVDNQYAAYLKAQANRGGQAGQLR